VPYGVWINNLPTWFFMVVHIAAFAIAVFFAWVSLDRDARVLASGFALYALAEVSYMTYHLDWTVFLFAHTISEVLDLVAFVCVFAGAVLGVRSFGRRDRVALEAS
jgi:predicted hotdog family 3-hydroxylacyl-ACP dehydratase